MPLYYGGNIETSMSFVNFRNTHAVVQVSATMNDFVFSHKKVNRLKIKGEFSQKHNLFRTDGIYCN